MFTLLVIGLIMFVLATQLAKRAAISDRQSLQIKAAAVVLAVIGLSGSLVKQVDAGFVGVQSLFGKIDNTVLYSGLNFVNPLVTVTDVDVKTRNYTMSAVHEEGNQLGDDAIKVLSKDGLEVVIDLTVLYRVNAVKAPDIIKEIGVDFENVVIRPLSRTQTRDAAVYYDAVELFSARRDEFEARVFKGIESEFAKRGIVLEKLMVRNINLPTSVKQAIESKINAEQESQKMQFVLTKEKQEADRKRVEAQGIADYQKIISEALTEKQLQYESIKAQKELAASPNSKIIIMGGRSNTPVILNTEK